jgi:hypothetical protein
MSQPELLKKVIIVLDKANIDYMATGSIVSSLQGEPRSTHDIDLVVLLEKSMIKELLKAFPPPNYYLDEATILDAMNRREMFNLLDIKEGDKVDFWMLTDDPFDRSRFSRKVAVEFMGLKIQISSPEDTILAKLRWAKLSGGSEKQYGDALRVYEVQFPKLDLEYLEYWVSELKLEEYWKRLKNEALIV